MWGKSTAREGAVSAKGLALECAYCVGGKARGVGRVKWREQEERKSAERGQRDRNWIIWDLSCYFDSEHSGEPSKALEQRTNMTGLRFQRSVLASLLRTDFP